MGMKTRRQVTVFAGWLLATLISAAIASQAVGSVRDQITDRPSPLVSSTIEAFVAGPATTTTSVPKTFVTVTDPPLTAAEGSVPETSKPAPSVTGGESTIGGSATSVTQTSLPGTTVAITTSPEPTTGGDGGNDSTTSSSKPSDSSSTSRPTSSSPSTSSTRPSTTTTSTTIAVTPPTSTTTTTAPPDGDLVHTELFNLDVGWVRIRYGEIRVVLAGAGPAPSWTMDVKDNGPRKVEVVFTRNSEKVAFRAEVEDGELVVEIQQDPAPFDLG